MAVAKNRRRLDVLAYRCTPALLGGATVCVREFPEGVRSNWRLLERNYQDRMGRDEVQAPYSIAISALRCLTGGYAYFDPERLFLVTRDPVNDDLLCDAFTLMSRLAAGEEIDDIDLGTPTPLAERIAGTPPAAAAPGRLPAEDRKRGSPTPRHGFTGPQPGTCRAA